jgi:hypothetical protein
MADPKKPWDDINDEDGLDFLKSLDQKNAQDDDDDEEIEAVDGSDDFMDEEDEGKAVDSYPREKRPARLDITKNSKEDHCFPARVTKKEAEDRLKKDYLYMQKMIVLPFVIMDGYPYKKKDSDSDIPDAKGKNVDKGPILVFGRLTKWKGVVNDEFKGIPYLIGEALYLKRGKYDIGDISRPHFALVIKKTYKKIKKKTIRDLFDPIKNELREGKPFEIYKKFPRIIE